MPRGTTLNFKKESQAFAKALQEEHLALGDLLVDIGVSAEASLPTNLSEDLIAKAKTAHERVRFQRARTEAARGRC